MCAHQIETRRAVTVKSEATALEAANLMVQHHISGLPVVSGTFLKKSSWPRQAERSETKAELTFHHYR
jgi:CBS domain-containing protein